MIDWEMEDRAALSAALTADRSGVPGDALRFRRLAGGNRSVRHYELGVPAGTFFLRMTDVPGDPELEQSLLEFLASRNVPVSTIAKFGSVVVRDRFFRWDLRPWMENLRPFEMTDADLSKGLGALRDMHLALREFPGMGRVMRHAETRAEKFEETLATLRGLLNRRSGPLWKAWMEPHAKWLQVLCDDFDPHVHRWPNAQGLHGDVHPGNLLFQRSNAVILDFEHSVHVFAPVEWDVAYFFQRFCLRDGSFIEPGPELRRTFEEIGGYDVSELPQWMRRGAWLCACVLLQQSFEGGEDVPREEFKKFVKRELRARLLAEKWTSLMG